MRKDLPLHQGRHVIKDELHPRASKRYAGWEAQEAWDASRPSVYSVDAWMNLLEHCNDGPEGTFAYQSDAPERTDPMPGMSQQAIGGSEGDGED